VFELIMRVLPGSGRAMLTRIHTGAGGLKRH
jgi:hypothetical protein